MDERSRRVCSSLKKIGIPSLDEMKAPFFAKEKKERKITIAKEYGGQDLIKHFK